MYWFPWLAIPIKNIYYFQFADFPVSYWVLAMLLFARLKNHLVSDFHLRPEDQIASTFSIVNETVWFPFISPCKMHFSDHASFMEIFSQLSLIFDNPLTHAQLTRVLCHRSGLINAAFRDNIVSLVPLVGTRRVLLFLFFLPAALNWR